MSLEEYGPPYHKECHFEPSVEPFQSSEMTCMRIETFPKKKKKKKKKKKEVLYLVQKKKKIKEQRNIMDINCEVLLQEFNKHLLFIYYTAML